MSDFKDYSIGSTINFGDIIQSIEYDIDKDYTVFTFAALGGDETSWAFNGNLTSRYSVGSSLKLAFHVVQSVGQFETLD